VSGEWLKVALRKKGWENGVWFEGVLMGVFGKDLVDEAKVMEREKDWVELGASREYMHNRCGKYKVSERKVIKEGKAEVSWVPLGVIGEMNVSEKAFEKCCKRKAGEGVDQAEANQSIDLSLNSYKHSFEIDRMFDWYLKMGFGVITEKRANTGVYVKLKPDGSKLQIISDRSAANKFDKSDPMSFRLFSAEKMKGILRSGLDVWIYSFDVSNFFHSFIIPNSMREAAPTIYCWKKLDGSSVNVEALRLVFGSSFSPVVSHAAGCEVLGIQDTVYDKSTVGSQNKTFEVSSFEFDLSDIYIDDFLEASVVKERARLRYEWKKKQFEEKGCGIKQKSVFEGVLQIDFAGKGYCGKKECARIGNTRKNKVKCIALLLWVIRKGLSKDWVESLVGSLCFLGSHLGWVFPFLNRASEWFHGNDSFRPEDILFDLSVGLMVASIPWSPRTQIMWVKGCVDPRKCIYVDAQNDFGRFGLVWWNGKEWSVRSIKIPEKYCCSQQCAELYGLKKAIGFGRALFGKVFTVASDSVGSLHALCRFKMASRAWRRNQLFRAIIKDLFGVDLMLWLLWIQSEFNPADGGSRECHEKKCVERRFEGCMEGIFEKCMGRTDFYSRVGPCVPQREHNERVQAED
jgi:hypothetical protein